MSRSSILIGFVCAIALQFFVLIGMQVKAALPLWTGEEVKVRTVPVDPRSMFRGNYARLNYEISSLPEDALNAYPRLRRGQVVYISLSQEEDETYGYSGASLLKPDKGPFIRGRISNTIAPYQVNYGVEAFFAPKDSALELERELRDGGVAVLMLTDNGRVALKEVVADL